MLKYSFNINEAFSDNEVDRFTDKYRNVKGERNYANGKYCRKKHEELIFSDIFQNL